MATTKKKVAKTKKEQTAKHVLQEEKGPKKISKAGLAFRKAVEEAKKNPIEYDLKAVLK